MRNTGAPSQFNSSPAIFYVSLTFTCHISIVRSGEVCELKNIISKIKRAYRPALTSRDARKPVRMQDQNKNKYMMIANKRNQYSYFILTDGHLRSLHTFKSRAQPKVCYHYQQDKLHLFSSALYLLQSMTERHNELRLVVFGVSMSDLSCSHPCLIINW